MRKLKPTHIIEEGYIYTLTKQDVNIRAKEDTPFEYNCSGDEKNYGFVMLNGERTGVWIAPFDVLVPIEQEQSMTFEEAMDVVYNLALRNKSDRIQTDNKLLKENDRQEQALDIVHDYIVNELGED